MKRRILALVFAMLMTVSLLSGCGNNNQPGGDGTNAATYNFKLACPDTEGGLTYIIATEFASKVSELTDGNVAVNIFGGSSLGTTTEVLEGMSAGVADILVESVGTLAPFTELANIDAMPYIYTGYEHFANVWASDLGDEMRTAIGEDSNFKLMGTCYRGARVVTSTYEMKTIKDFQGFKLRAPALDMYVKTWEWLGASPTPLAITDVYTAIQQKTVMGQENSIIDSVNYSFDELCDYFILTNHVYSANTVVMDLGVFNGLPAEYQAAIEEAAEYACDIGSQTILDNEEAAKAELVENGITIVEVDNAAFVEAFDGFAEKNFPELADWANAIREMQ